MDGKNKKHKGIKKRSRTLQKDGVLWSESYYTGGHAKKRINKKVSVNVNERRRT